MFDWLFKTNTTNYNKLSKCTDTIDVSILSIVEFNNELKNILEQLDNKNAIIDVKRIDVLSYKKITLKMFFIDETGSYIFDIHKEVSMFISNSRTLKLYFNKIVDRDRVKKFKTIKRLNPIIYQSDQIIKCIDKYMNNDIEN